MKKRLKLQGLTREDDQALIQKKESYDHLDESEKENQGQALPYSAPISVPWAGILNYLSSNNNTGNYNQARFFQKAYGNIASLRLNRKSIQAKLKIGQPNDKYEQEADRVAEQVMRMPDRSCIECKEEERPGEKITRHANEETNHLQRQEKEANGVKEIPEEEEEEEEKPEEGSLLQTKLISPEPYLIQRQLEEESERIKEPLKEANKEGLIKTKLKKIKNTPGDEYEHEADHVAEQIMRMTEPSTQRMCAKWEGRDRIAAGTIRRAYASTPSPASIRRQESRANVLSEAPQIISEVVSEPGRPLDPLAQSFMESRFGYDFSHVKIHTGSRAAESARAVNAVAYTVGRNVIFDEGAYRPETDAGRRLIAHELTHVLQQGTVDTLIQSDSENEFGDNTTPQTDQGFQVAVMRVIEHQRISHGSARPLMCKENHAHWTNDPGMVLRGAAGNCEVLQMVKSHAAKAKLQLGQLEHDSLSLTEHPMLMGRRAGTHSYTGDPLPVATRHSVAPALRLPITRSRTKVIMRQNLSPLLDLGSDIVRYFDRLSRARWTFQVRMYRSNMILGILKFATRMVAHVHLVEDMFKLRARRAELTVRNLFRFWWSRPPIKDLSLFLRTKEFVDFEAAKMKQSVLRAIWLQDKFHLHAESKINVGAILKRLYPSSNFWWFARRLGRKLQVISDTYARAWRSLWRVFRLYRLFSKIMTNWIAHIALPGRRVPRTI